MHPITKIVTKAPQEPVEVSEVKDHLRIEHSEHDELLESLIQASREYVEDTTGQALVEKTRAAYYQYWPITEGRFIIPWPPLQSVNSVKYTDTNGTEHTFSSDKYTVIADSKPGYLVLKYGESWPAEVIPHDEYPITIEFVCGYPATEDSPKNYTKNIPQSIKNAIKLDVELRYDRPNENYSERIEQVIHSLLAPYRVWW